MDNGLNDVDKENGMNGWQRLWVVLIVVVAVIIIADKYESFPTQMMAYAELGNRVGFWMNCERYYRDIAAERKNSAVECTAYTKQHVEEKLKFEVAAYKNKLDTLPERQWKTVANAFGLWAGLNLIAFLIVVSTRWVIRGFRPKKLPD